MPAHLLAFWDRFGTHSVAVGDVTMRGAKTLVESRHGVLFASLPSGELLARGTSRRTRRKAPVPVQAIRVLWRTEGGRIQVVADSLLEFFERLSEGMPPWFLRPGYQPIEELH